MEDEWIEIYGPIIDAHSYTDKCWKPFCQACHNVILYSRILVLTRCLIMEGPAVPWRWLTVHSPDIAVNHWKLSVITVVLHEAFHDPSHTKPPTWGLCLFPLCC